MTTTLITGITGQDGAYLARFLLERGERVVGTYRRSSTPNFWRLKYLDIYDNSSLTLVEMDLTDIGNAARILARYKVERVYNLAAQSFVGVSFEQPVTTLDITGGGVVNLLEAIRIVDPCIKFYQASTSELFGLVQEVPQSETTPFYPRSPYGVAKLYGHWITINYRESFDMFAATGILFNHESPLRGEEFVTRKITRSVAAISLGMQDNLKLGNLDAKRDWGFAGDYVVGMFKILDYERPDNFVLATGVTTTVREFAKQSFAHVGIELHFEGEGVNERGVDVATGRELVIVSPEFFRPAEVDLLIGDPAKAKELLDWEPTVTVNQLSRMMVEADLADLAKIRN